MFLIKRLPSNEDSGGQIYGWWLHILLRWLHSWLAQHTRVSVEASAKQTPINLAPLDASLRESTQTQAVIKSFRRILALLPPMLLRWPENRQRAKQYCLLENSRETLLSSNYAKTESVVPIFKIEKEQAIDAQLEHHTNKNCHSHMGY